MVAKRKSKALLSPWNFFNFVLISFIFVAIFVGTFLVQKPKKEEATQAGDTIMGCDYQTIVGETDWDPKRYVDIDFDDSYYGPLTDQYFWNDGVYFEYDMRKGIGLYKVEAANPLNPGNGYVRTVTASEPWAYPLPGSSLTESSLFLSFPSPVEMVRFQLQYDEPFDLLDIDREVPRWGVMVKICDESGHCPYWANPDTLTMYSHFEDPVVTLCWRGWRGDMSHAIKTIEIRIENNINDATGAVPPPKLTLDNLRIQYPRRWEEPTVTPTLAPVDPGICECAVDLPGKENDTEAVDECNFHDDYRIVDCTPECVCGRSEG